MNRFFPYFCTEKLKQREKEILNHHYRDFDHRRAAFR